MSELVVRCREVATADLLRPPLEPTAARRSFLPIPPPSAVDVWWSWLHDLEDRMEPGASILTEEERHRTRSYLRAADSRAFMLGRQFLRCLLGAYLGTPPHRVRLGYGKRGKPFADGSVEFSVAQSGDLLLVAVTSSRAVGVDVEKHSRDADLLLLASRYFTPDEYRTLLDAGGELRVQRFFQVWTRKEAYLKAFGQGMEAILEAPSVLRSTLAGGVELKDVPVPRGYSAALAVAPPSG